jgi:hypothetical protein
VHNVKVDPMTYFLPRLILTQHRYLPLKTAGS